MNPTQTTGANNTNSLFVNSFETKVEKDNSEPAELIEVDLEVVSHSEEDKLSIQNSWAEFYALKTEDIPPITAETSVKRVEIADLKFELFNEAPKNNEATKSYEIKTVEVQEDSKPINIIEKQKGSGSWLEDAGFQLNIKGLLNVFGNIGKSLFGALNIFREIAMDTTKLLVKSAKGEKPAEKDPAKIQAAAEKKAENQRKQNNIRAFYEGLKAQMSSAPIEAVRAETQEKENINKTIKLTNISYKGIKTAAGRLTVYAASMFEREQLEQDRQYKKMEKQQKKASTGPDLNLDKAAEGGFLSSTGGQGAG